MKILKNVKLAPYSTFDIGGPAKFFVQVKNVEELRDAINFAKSKRVKVFILGGGSNILVPDQGINGLVVKMAIKGIKSLNNRSSVLVSAGAGEVWDNVVAQAVKNNFGGIENLS